MSVSLIAAVGRNRELGVNGKLVWHGKADMKYFRETTNGHPILMGRKTFESLPKLLPGRLHLVVTREAKADFFEKYHLAADAPVKIVNDLSEVVQDYNLPDEEEELFVIGGGMVYWETWKECGKLYLTEVEADFSEADTFFPEFDKSLYEREVVGKGEENGIKFQFVVYTRKEQPQSKSSAVVGGSSLMRGGRRI